MRELKWAFKGGGGHGGGGAEAATGKLLFGNVGNVGGFGELGFIFNEEGGRGGGGGGGGGVSFDKISEFSLRLQAEALESLNWDGGELQKEWKDSSSEE